MYKLKTITKPLKEISTNDIHIVGGKGASLGEMIRAKISVPNGFVILTKVFDNFLEDARISKDIKNELRKLNKRNNNVETISNYIQKIILEAEIQEEVQNQILSEFKKLGVKFVAVRSSATAEDSVSAAWAGQLDSFLNTTEKTLLENVKKCWASLFSRRAILYSLKKGSAIGNISVAVVIQEMIESEKSGVAFSIHPVTENPEQIIIESVFGLGEALVSGKIIPDTYIISKKDHKITDINIHKQAKGLYRKNSGGNLWKSIGSFGNEQTLTNKQIIALTKIIKKIENHYKSPQDIEWSASNDNFYIMQSRPITTLNSNIQRESFSHILASKRIILAFLAMELWTRSETVRRGVGPRNNPIFFHIKGNEYRIYYDKNYVGYYNNYDYITNEKIFQTILKKFLKINERLDKLLQKRDIKFSKKMIDLMFDIFRYTDYFFFARIDRNMTLVSKERRKSITKIRIHSEKIIHDTFDFLLRYANDILHQVNNSDSSYKKNVFLADYIREQEFFTIIENSDKDRIGKILNKAKKYAGIKNFIYHIDKIYTNERALKFIKIFADLENQNTFYGQRNGRGSLYGNTVVQGDVTGRAIFIKNWKEIHKINTVRKPVILICEDLTPEITSAINMNKVKGVIVSTGSILSHAAIVAREFNKPSAVNVQNLSELKDGTKIRLVARPAIANIYLV